MGMESVYKLSVILNMVDNLSGQMGGVGNNVTNTVNKLNTAFWNYAEGRSGNGRSWRCDHRALHEDGHSHL